MRRAHDPIRVPVRFRDSELGALLGWTAVLLGLAALIFAAANVSRSAILVLAECGKGALVALSGVTGG